MISPASAVDVRDHHAAVGVADEHDRAVDGANQVADGGGVGGEAAQRVGGRDDAVTGVEQRVDDAVPARRLGERAVDEHDRGAHEEVLRLEIGAVLPSLKTGRHVCL